MINMMINYGNHLRHQEIGCDFDKNNVDESKVDSEIKYIISNYPESESSLANSLRDPNLNQAEKERIIEKLAKEDTRYLSIFYGNDHARDLIDPSGGIHQDHKIIGQALQKSYKDGEINVSDLIRISDVNKAGNGAQRFIDILKIGGGSELNGSIEGLSDALWERNGNNGLDRAGAALGYLSSPELISRNLNTKEKRIEAFEALLKFNASSVKTPGAAGDFWYQSSLAAAGRLFTANSQEFLDYYTGANFGKAQPKYLSIFMSQTIFNPDAFGITLDRHRDLVSSTRDAFDSYTLHLLNSAGDSSTGSSERRHAARQLGYFAAGVIGGVTHALTRYDDKISEHNSIIKQLSSIVGSLISKTPINKIWGADDFVDEVSEDIFEIIINKPEAPNRDLGFYLEGIYYDRITYAEKITDEALINEYEAAYGRGLQNIQGELNINLGGHEK